MLLPILILLLVLAPVLLPAVITAVHTLTPQAQISTPQRAAANLGRRATPVHQGA
jgi:hypothetical protein